MSTFFLILGTIVFAKKLIPNSCTSWYLGSPAKKSFYLSTSVITFLILMPTRVNEIIELRLFVFM